MSEAIITEKLYNHNSHLQTFQAVVLSCEPDKKGYSVVLDATAFFPEGGGQSADTGFLNHIRVLDVQEKNDCIFHYTEQPLTPGETVTGTLDWEKRFDRMQQHSGEHIMSGLVHARFGYDNVGFHLGDEEVTLDFNGSLTAEELAEIEWQANQAVAENFEVVVSYPSKEELTSLSYRSKIEIQGQVRLVEYPGYDLCACCAPHVNRTGEIGMIKVTRLQNYKGGVRVTILCGFRALRDYREKDRNIKAISQLLSVKEASSSDAVIRLKDELYTVNGKLMDFQKNMFTQELEKIPMGSENRFCFFSEGDPNAIRDFVNGLMTRCSGYCAAFFGNDESGYRYIIGSSSCDIRPVGKHLNELCSGRGGGKPEMIQGSLSASRSAIEQALSSFSFS